jgi:hypothetical protein
MVGGSNCFVDGRAILRHDDTGIDQAGDKTCHARRFDRARYSTRDQTLHAVDVGAGFVDRQPETARQQQL